MHRTKIASQERPVTGRAVIAVMMLAGAVTWGIAWASEDVDGRAGSPRKIVMQNDDRITPSALTMNRTDVLEFENDSGQFMRLVFVEPPDQAEKIRCYLTDHTIARPDQMPWLLFDWGPGRRLTATIPPGKFASACSLAPGQYAFVTKRVSRDARAVPDSLGTKGTIAVQ
jgi:hypothetical protein